MVEYKRDKRGRRGGIDVGTPTGSIMLDALGSSLSSTLDLENLNS